MANNKTENPREILVQSLKTNKENGVLELKVSWHDTRRAYHLSCTPLTREVRNGMETISFGLLSGEWVNLERAERFNFKKLQALAAAAPQDPRYPQLIAAVLEKNKLTLI